MQFSAAEQYARSVRRVHIPHIFQIISSLRYKNIQNPPKSKPMSS